MEGGGLVSCMGRAKSHLKTHLSRQLQKSHQGMYLTESGAAAVITACKSLLGNAVRFLTGTFLSKTQKLMTACKMGDQDPELCKGPRVPGPKSLTRISLIQSYLGTFIEHLIFVI